MQNPQNYHKFNNIPNILQYMSNYYLLDHIWLTGSNRCHWRWKNDFRTPWKVIYAASSWGYWHKHECWSERNHSDYSTEGKVKLQCFQHPSNYDFCVFLLDHLLIWLVNSPFNCSEAANIWQLQCDLCAFS